MNYICIIVLQSYLPVFRYMSPFGPLPVQCFPDALPHLDAIQAKGLVGTEEQVLDCSDS